MKRKLHREVKSKERKECYYRTKTTVEEPEHGIDAKKIESIENYLEKITQNREKGQGEKRIRGKMVVMEIKQ